MTAMRDTSVAARQIQVAALRRLDGPARLQMALNMSEQGRQVTLAGIRYRHPEWTDAAIHRELLRLMLGRDLSAAVLKRLPTSP